MRSGPIHGGGKSTGLHTCLDHTHTLTTANMIIQSTLREHIIFDHLASVAHLKTPGQLAEYHLLLHAAHVKPVPLPETPKGD